MGITLKDIAKRSGFGYGTVSRALSEMPYLVKKETREKIQKIAEKYGYKKNPFARALISGKTRDIGLVVPAMFASPYYRDFYMKVIAGVMDGFVGREYRLRVMFIRDKSEVGGILDDIERLKLRGIILSPYCYDFVLGEKDIRRMKIPVVVLGKKVKGDNITSIILDDRKGGYDGTCFLIELGHKKIAIIRGFRKDIEERFEGYKMAMESNGLKIHNEFVLQGDALEGSGYEMTSRVLNGKNKPTAIFCLDDEMAYGALKAVKASGRKCPDDVSILGFDGLEIDNYTDPALTTMQRPVKEMAALAVKVLINEEAGVKEEVIKMEARLTVLASCGRP